ncbi:rna recognition motif-containing protein [Cystoisospora suis]|uniref:Rna recognition motif-containing protein n=1 Tax=Cystoisospora suis TaxID=483139 RepID=A0A2C6L7N6_9APIC|nr:rna recognition motif-containing protein [Cystoisospora suis]
MGSSRGSSRERRHTSSSSRQERRKAKATTARSRSRTPPPSSYEEKDSHRKTARSSCHKAEKWREDEEEGEEEEEYEEREKRRPLDHYRHHRHHTNGDLHVHARNSDASDHAGEDSPSSSSSSSASSSSSSLTNTSSHSSNSSNSSSRRKNAFTDWREKIERLVNEDTDQKSGSRGGRNPDRDKQIYVGALPRHATEEEVRAVFSSFGPITKVFHPKAGNSFLFLEYSTVDAAEMAVQAMQGFVLKGKMIHVTSATHSPLEKIRQSNSSSSSSSSSSTAGGGGGGGENAGDSKSDEMNEKNTSQRGGGSMPPPPPHSASQMAPPKRVILPKKKAPSRTGLFGISPYQQFATRAESEDLMNKVEGSRVVKVSNLPPDFEQADIKQVFDVFGAVMRIDCYLHRREAFIHFFEKSHANTAVNTMHGFDVGGYRLHVTLDSRNGAEPSTVVVLRNLMHFSQLDNDVQNEIYQECKKHGKVLERQIVQCVC